jgi:hypothetical protein
MIRRYHNKAAIRIQRQLFDEWRRYRGDSRHRRRRQFARAYLITYNFMIGGGC